MDSEGTVQVQGVGCCSVKSFLSSDCGNKSLTLLDEAGLFVVSSGSIAEDSRGYGTIWWGEESYIDGSAAECTWQTSLFWSTRRNRLLFLLMICTYVGYRTKQSIVFYSLWYIHEITILQAVQVSWHWYQAIRIWRWSNVLTVPHTSSTSVRYVWKYKRSGEKCIQALAVSIFFFLT